MLREFNIILQTIILTVVCVSVVLGLVSAILYEFGMDIERYNCIQTHKNTYKNAHELCNNAYKRRETYVKTHVNVCKTLVNACKNVHKMDINACKYSGYIGICKQNVIWYE